MTLHLAVHLPDGRDAWIDYREPIAGRPKGAAFRCLRKLSRGEPQNPADLAKVAAWLDEHEKQSARCRDSHGMPPRPPCGHEEEETI